MLIKRKRLEKGWSQGQLAEFSGLSLRTIQRIEKGQPATSESLKCLASVFEVDLMELQDSDVLDESSLSEEETQELQHIRETKRFVIQFAAYLMIVPLICLAGYLNGGYIRNGLTLALGWGLWLAYCGLRLFDTHALFGKGWEKRELHKRMGRKDK